MYVSVRRERHILLMKPLAAKEWQFEATPKHLSCGEPCVDLQVVEDQFFSFLN